MDRDRANHSGWATLVLSSASIVVGVLAASAGFFPGLFDDNDKGRTPETPAVTQLPAEQVEALDIAGDHSPEFVRIDGEILSVPDSKTWVDRWGATVAGGLVAGLFAVAAAVLSRPRQGVELENRLDRIEELLAKPPVVSPTTSSARNSRRPSRRSPRSTRGS